MAAQKRGPPTAGSMPPIDPGGVDDRRERQEVLGRVRRRLGAVQLLRQPVLERFFGLHDLGFEQVDGLFLAVVLRFLEAGDGDRGVELTPRELGCRDPLLRGDRQLLPLGVGACFAFGVDDRFDDGARRR